MSSSSVALRISIPIPIPTITVAPSPAWLESSISKSAMEIIDKVSRISLAYPQSRRAFI
uniref:Uncharacterized protein n=1 Tax=Anguilla anguilla TaxID=7936 RepID=A0A0E9R5E0_ANGAN